MKTSTLAILSVASALPAPEPQNFVTVYQPAYQPAVNVVTVTVTLPADADLPTATALPTSDNEPEASDSASSSSDSQANSDYASQANSTNFETSILNTHNMYRAGVEYPVFTWSDSLASFAQNAANTCVMQHTANNPNGENIYMTTASSVSGYDAATAWYDEVDQYNQMFAGQSSGDFTEQTGHYTQLIWKSSTELGCAQAQCSSGVYVFCEYSPPGNVQGQYQDNVPAPGTMSA